MDKFNDRSQAGKMLATYLKAYANNPNALILALPRGGLPVAYEVAVALALPLDVFIVRKLGVPWHAELAMGALASGNTIYLNEDLIKRLSISKNAIDACVAAEQKELQRRGLIYRGRRPNPVLKDKIIILVDDGIATGATITVAIKAIKQHNPARIVVAVPVAAKQSCDEIGKEVDELVCPLQPEFFYAVGLWYEDFSQTTDEEVTEILRKLDKKVN